MRADVGLMKQYSVWDRMSSSPDVGHLRMITTDKAAVDKLIAGDDWRFVVTTEEIDE